MRFLLLALALLMLWPTPAATQTFEGCDDYSYEFEIPDRPVPLNRGFESVAICMKAVVSGPRVTFSWPAEYIGYVRANTRYHDRRYYSGPRGISVRVIYSQEGEDHYAGFVEARLPLDATSYSHTVPASVTGKTPISVRFGLSAVVGRTGDIGDILVVGVWLDAESEHWSFMDDEP